jgi:hypothetical protein
MFDFLINRIYLLVNKNKIIEYLYYDISKIHINFF